MSDSHIAYAALVALCTTAVICFACGDAFRTGMMQREAIAHNAAHHDPVTGAFTWNTP